MLPNLLVIGAQKGGTTSLWQYLQGHPEIYMSQPKEIHFFNRDDNWARGADWYEGHFVNATGFAVRGEATPGYTRAGVWPHSAQRAASLVPEARLIYILRDPLARIRSHYLHNVSLGIERRAFAEAVLSDPQYVDASRYAEQAHRWLHFFSSEQFLFLLSHDLRADRQATMERVFDFLGVATRHLVGAEDYHVTSARKARRQWVRRVQESSLYRIAATNTSQRVKDRVRPYLSPAIDQKLDLEAAEWTPELRASISQRLRDDRIELESLYPAIIRAWPRI